MHCRHINNLFKEIYFKEVCNNSIFFLCNHFGETGVNVSLRKRIYLILFCFVGLHVALYKFYKFSFLETPIGEFTWSFHKTSIRISC